MKKLISMLLVLVMALSMFSGISLAADTVQEPKVIATASDATTEAAVIENPSEVKFWEPRKLTYAEHQKLIQDIAVTYYYQSNEASHIQYDGKEVDIGSKLERHADDGRPEDAWFDSTVYSVCSNYPWKVYRTAYSTDYKLFRMPYARSRSWADFNPDKTPELVYQYSGPLAKNSKGETDFEKALVESRKLVQPGDILAHCNVPDGHALLFVGPIFKDFGDNTDYILHCMGSSYSTSGQEDREDPGQCINLIKADETVWGPVGSKWSFRNYDNSSVGFAILRPWQDPAIPETPTQEAMCRMQFPRMKITRELDRHKFDAVQNGEEVPVYLTISNKSAQDYVEVPVEEYIPEGTTLVEGSATKTARVEGNTIKWSVKVPAGKSITLTYKVKVNAKLGTTVDFKGGLVGGIASRSTSLTVGGKQLTAEQHKAIYDYGVQFKEGKTASWQNLDFVNKLYKEALGLELNLPKTLNMFLSKVVEEKDGIVYRSGADKTLDRMIVPLHFAGQYADPSGGVWARTREFKEEYYEPGDIFIRLRGENKSTANDVGNVELLIYLGEKRVLSHSKKGTYFKSFDATVGYILMDNLIITLRPTFAHEDISNIVTRKMSFTDVKQGDWFHTFVEDLVLDGVVNGMTETTFVPNGTLTYGQALKLVTVGLGFGEQAAQANGHWASGYLALAKERGWLTGNVDLNGKITRQAFCQIAAKAAGLTKQPASNPFKDTTDTSVLALVEAGVINGMTKNTFAPNGSLTRAQISKIIWYLRDAK